MVIMEESMAEEEEINGNIPNIDCQKQLIQSQIGKAMAADQTFYLIDSEWFRKFKRYVGIPIMWEKNDISHEHPGPIDNTPLFSEDGSRTIKENLIDELEYTLIPSESWDLLVDWYGTVDNHTAIPRKVIDYGIFLKQYKVEVYLLELKLCKNFQTECEVVHKFSKGNTILDIENVMRQIFKIKDGDKTRMWGYFGNGAEEITKKDQSLQTAGIFQHQIIVIQTKDDEGNWIEAAKSRDKFLPLPTRTNYTNTTKISTNEKTILDPGPSSSTSTIMPAMFNPYGFSCNMIRPTAPGLCGLKNLGNTCFMNSVLQCMSNCPPISEYFISDGHLNELNKTNPLGMKGEIANTFGCLIKIMWSGNQSFALPISFKFQVGSFAPQFSGNQQHDSQEFLTFLLDGLHEDLNRIKQLPYIELQDSSGRPDKEVSKEAWENYRKRNDSVIVDFFHGLLKSTVICLDCNKVSITFDPFCYLSLPLPSDRERTLEVSLFQYEPQFEPTSYTLVVPENGNIKDLVSKLSLLSGIPEDHLIVTEVNKSHFHKFFDKTDSLKRIDDHNEIYVYEMPPHKDTHVIMPVYLWEPTEKQVFSHDHLFGDPLLITVHRNECTVDLLYQIVIHKLYRYLHKPDENSSWWHPQKMPDEELTFMNDNDTTACDSDFELGENRRPFCLYLMTNTSFGWEGVKLHNDGRTPFLLPEYMGQSFFALRWSQEGRENFFVNRKSDNDKVDKLQKDLQTLKLRDCINLYTRREKLGASNSWYCPNCEKHQQATKKFDLWNLPKILIFHLKRFIHDRLRRGKVTEMVHFPIKGLNMSDYVINEDHPEAVYDLIGVCNHEGGLCGGHYFAYCKNRNDHKWYLFDDTNVSEVDENSVVSNSAYVLFYMLRI